MDTNEIESTIRARIPGADVDAKIKGATLCLTAVFDAKNQLDAHRRVFAALSNTDVADIFIAVQLRWFSSEGQRSAQSQSADLGLLKLKDSFSSYPTLSPGWADDEDDDGDDSNPNWPSRTGNPSGGGRGNNPPRR